MRRVPALLALLLAGCPADLEKQSHVSKLRVLGVRAEPAELVLDPTGPLPSTTLTAFAVDPSDAGISMRFALCTRLGDAPPADLPCPGEAGLDLPDAGPLAARLDLADPRIVALASQTDAGVVLPSLAEGIPLIVGFRATAGAQELDGFASITLRTNEHGPANRNPTLTGLLIDDQLAPDAGTLPINTQTTVRLQPLTESKDDASKRYGYSFFATAGELSSLRSTDKTATGQDAPTWVEWTSPREPLPKVHFWIVLRDGRGGTHWMEHSVQVR
jgi:hypothetical protein